MNDRCPHCKDTAAEDEVLFFESAQGFHCQHCGGKVEFTARGRAVKASVTHYLPTPGPTTTPAGDVTVREDPRDDAYTVGVKAILRVKSDWVDGDPLPRQAT